MEGEAGPILGICVDGWWFGRVCGMLRLPVCCLFMICSSFDAHLLIRGTEQAVLALKYIQPGYPLPTLYFGIANVIANGLIMLR